MQETHQVLTGPGSNKLPKPNFKTQYKHADLVIVKEKKRDRNEDKRMKRALNFGSDRNARTATQN